MDTKFAATFAILIAVFALISLRRYKGHKIPSYLVVLVGGACVLLIGATTPRGAWGFIDWNIIGLLLGMMLITAALDWCGFFHLVADKLIKRYPDRTSFLCATVVFCSLLCTVILNDALIMIFTPIVIVFCKRMKADPFPYVVAVFTAANIGCAATFIGAPHCALCASFANLSFLKYTLIALPIVLLCTWITMVIFKRHFRKDLEKDYEFNHGDEDGMRELDRSMMYVCLQIMTAMLVLFALDEFTHFGLGLVAVIGGLAQILIVSARGLGATRYVFKHVNWEILVFFFGLFVLIAGVRDAGVIDFLANVCNIHPDTTNILDLSIFTLILSNLMSNVPAVAIVGNIIHPGTPILWATLSIISSFCANLTIIGQAANLIGIGEAEKRGIRIDFLRHFKVGLPVTAATCIVSVAYLYGVSFLIG